MHAADGAFVTIETISRALSIAFTCPSLVRPHTGAMEHELEVPAGRVRRAFAFVDICGFTRLADDRGDEAAVEALVAFRSDVRSACTRHGVRVAKWLGDGAMLVGVEGTPLIQATHDIVTSGPGVCHPPQVRAGMASGDVLIFEGDDYIGRVVNLAARLCDVARGHQLLCQMCDSQHLPSTLVLRPQGAWGIPGFRSPIEVGLAEPSNSPQPALSG